jgi:hypothetical protein
MEHGQKGDFRLWRALPAADHSQTGPLARAAAASTDGKTHICISSTAAACALPRHKILFQLSANPPEWNRRAIGEKAS